MKFGTNSGIFLPFSAFFGHFLWESRDISSFSENIREILIKFHQNFAEKWPNSLTKVGMKWNFISFHFIPAKKFDGFLLEFWGVSGAKAKKSCRARKMLKNEPTLAIVAVDTGENEPLKVWDVSFHYFNRILNGNHAIDSAGSSDTPTRWSIWAWQFHWESQTFTFFVARKDTIEIMKWNTANFEGLVILCIDSYDSKSSLIF